MAQGADVGAGRREGPEAHAQRARRRALARKRLPLGARLLSLHWPSFEMEVQFKGTDWLEVFGAGVIHANILTWENWQGAGSNMYCYYCFRNSITFYETRLLSGTLILQLCVESIGTNFLCTLST